MLAYIKGNILTHTAHGAIVVNAGLGYELIGAWLHSHAVNDQVEAFVYQYLENQSVPRLIACQDQESRSLLTSLLTVSGVGPKMAGRILDSFSARALHETITTSDISSLSRVKGLGKKTAQKIILELGKSLILDEGQHSEVVEAITALGFSSEEVHLVMRSLNLDGLNEKDQISLIIKKLGKVR